jgi:hypothetical protein
VHLNPWKLIAEQPRATAGARWPGVLVLATWLVAVAVAWRYRHRRLIALDAVLGGALFLGLVSMSRIHGIVWYYLVLWAWGVTALLVLTIGWAARLVLSTYGPRALPRADALVSVALLAIVAVSTVAFGVHAARAERPAPTLSDTLGRLVPPTATALAGEPAGRGGPYLVTWYDPISIGAQGFGLLNELERRGFHVGARQLFTAGVRAHRVVVPTRAAAEVHLAVGPDIAVWRATPGARQVAYVDRRTAAEKAEYARLRVRAIRLLRRAGVDVLVPAVDNSLFTTIIDARVPPAAVPMLTRMHDIGLPTAVFIGPRPAR